MGNNSGFSQRIYQYLKYERKVPDTKLKEMFNQWYATNLGHIFEHAALASYGVSKNLLVYNRRIPDGVEDGMLEQIMQYTRYPASTFIEVKYMAKISLDNSRIGNQIRDMIDFLSTQELHQTYTRYIGSALTPNPGKASEEGLAILVFLTPYHTIVHKNIIEYAESKKVVIYQMQMRTRYENQQIVCLTKPTPLTKPSPHLFGHFLTPKSVSVNWEAPIIDPNSGLPVKEER